MGGIIIANIIPVTKVTEVPSSIFITDILPYLDARTQADEWSKETDLVIATMPQLAAAMKSAKAREAIRPRWADVDSVEYHGVHNGEKVYAVAHGTGPFSSTERLRQGFDRMGNYGFMTVDDGEWQSLMNGAVHLSDLKRGVETGDKYVVFVRADKDKPRIMLAGQLKFESKEGAYDSFMDDDIALMRAGSEDARQTIADTIRGEGHSSIGNYHRIKEVGFGKPTAGRPLYLDSDKCGLGGLRGRDGDGRFPGVAPEMQTQDKPLEKRI